MKILSYILCFVLVVQTAFSNAIVCAAGEIGSNAQVITDLKKLTDAERIYHFTKADKPDLESLLEMFPETLEVFLTEEAEAISLDVNWYCVGEDYENSEAYYFQFSPVWDEAQYPVGDDIEIPYISVFLSDGDGISELDVTGNGNETIIYEFLRSEMGLNIAAACGVLANIYHESGFNPKATGDNGTSYGICQWHNERWDAMKSWCEKFGYDWTTLTGQLYYLRFELSQNDSSYLWNGKTIYNYISNVPDTEEGAYKAGHYWCFYYEVPANREVVSVTRGNLAKDIYWAEYGYVDHEPIGNLDKITEETGGIRIQGWAFDPDVMEEMVTIRVYVDGVQIVDVATDEYRTDVNEEYRCGDYHGFNDFIPISSAGTHTVSLYALSTASDETTLELGSAEVVIKPVVDIKEVAVTEVSEEGYTVTCVIDNMDQIDRVQFPTWTVANGKDDLDASWESSEECRGTINGNQVSYRVNVLDHNGENGLYNTYIYAYDKEGNAVCIPVAASVGVNELTPQSTVYFEGNFYAVYAGESTLAERLTWTWAKTYAESIGGHLVTIQSQEEQDAVNALIVGEAGGYWIGGTDEAEDGVWKWVTEEEMSYQNWTNEISEDLSGMKDYAAFLADSMSWSAEENNSGLTSYGFICEIENHEHIYTDDRDASCNICGDIREVAVKSTPMYRLYNPNSGEHFYTGSVEERDMLVEAGWTYEGVAWNAPIYEGDPVYRVFNSNSGDHHYTMSQDEVDMLVEAGWKYEGVAWNSASADNLPLYRLYNPNADCGSHHYTGSTEERDFLVSVGWYYEGIGWFGLLK